MCRIACSVCDRITTVERAVVEAGEAALEVALDHVDAVAHARRARRRRRSRCRSRVASRCARAGTRAGAVAAAEVEHARAVARSSRRSSRSRRARDVVRRRRAALRARALHRARQRVAVVGDRLARDAVEVRAHHRVILRIVEQERVVAVRRDDLRVRDVAPVVDQRLHDLARARGREAPVGRERDDEEAARRRRERAREVAAGRASPGRSSRAPW